MDTSTAYTLCELEKSLRIWSYWKIALFFFFFFKHPLPQVIILFQIFIQILIEG